MSLMNGPQVDFLKTDGMVLASARGRAGGHIRKVLEIASMGIHDSFGDLEAWTKEPLWCMTVTASVKTKLLFMGLDQFVERMPSFVTIPMKKSANIKAERWRQRLEALCSVHVKNGLSVVTLPKIPHVPEEKEEDESGDPGQTIMGGALNASKFISKMRNAVKVCCCTLVTCMNGRWVF